MVQGWLCVIAQVGPLHLWRRVCTIAQLFSLVSLKVAGLLDAQCNEYVIMLSHLRTLSLLLLKLKQYPYSNLAMSV